ncbi:hypothetical protein HY636_01805 [Candidatus Woesearchaeota archaeon]|nr:hypothetical protein [Candidatus Woesearchaeota archaeon]
MEHAWMIVGNVVDINNNTDNLNFLNNNYHTLVPQVSFEIFEGNGNVFAIIDERIHNISNDETRSKLSREVCNSSQIQNKRIDGLLFLQPSNVADIKMRIFEKDGSESDMCGNGLRCIAKYLEHEFCLSSEIGNLYNKITVSKPKTKASKQKTNIPNQKINIETNSGIFLTEVIGDTVTVDMGFPQDPLKYVNLQKAVFNLLTTFCAVFAYKNCSIYLLNSGEPHGVLIVDDVNNVDLTGFLAFIQNRDIFPFGINLNAMQIIDDRNIRIRTLERGLWATTLCCGTGSTSCATLMWMLNSSCNHYCNPTNDNNNHDHTNQDNNNHNNNNPNHNNHDNNEIRVINDGGDIYLKFSKNNISMIGSAKKIGSANYQVNLLRK